MKAILFFMSIWWFTGATFAQKPKDGTYTYTIAFAEWQGKSLGCTCTVIIKGNAVTLVHNGNENLAGKKGEILAKGTIMKHKSGVWIIGDSPSDVNAPEVGGCSDGPMEIDFTHKKVWFC